jgi:hypothetical protein
MYYYIRCRALKVAGRLFMLSVHIWTMIREGMSLSVESRTMSWEIMSMIMKSITHSTCLPDPLTFQSYGYKIDIDRRMYSPAMYEFLILTYFLIYV